VGSVVLKSSSTRSMFYWLVLTKSECQKRKANELSGDRTENESEIATKAVASNRSDLQEKKYVHTNLLLTEHWRAKWGMAGTGRHDCMSSAAQDVLWPKSGGEKNKLGILRPEKFPPCLLTVVATQSQQHNVLIQRIFVLLYPWQE